MLLAPCIGFSFQSRADSIGLTVQIQCWQHWSIFKCIADSVAFFFMAVQTCLFFFTAVQTCLFFFTAVQTCLFFHGSTDLPFFSWQYRLAFLFHGSTDLPFFFHGSTALPFFFMAVQTCLFFSWQYRLSLILKAPNKNCRRQHFNFLLLCFKENKA